MKIYSDYAGRRTRQIVIDVLALAAIAAWAWLGWSVYRLVMNLADLGVQLEESGKGFKTTMTDISDSLSGVWLIGNGIKAPFDAASDAGATLQSAGQAQQVAVQQLATGLGLGIAVLPILTILLFWLVPRIRFVRRASVAARMVAHGASIDLLAFRALANQRVGALVGIDADVAGAWRRSDQSVIRALANLELRSSGVRLRDEPLTGPPQAPA